MLKNDPNLKKLLLWIKKAGKIPKELLVVKCTGCGDTIFISPEQSQKNREYWKNVYLGNRCRYHEKTGCPGVYQKIKLTLKKVDSLLKPVEPEQIKIPSATPPISMKI